MAAAMTARAIAAHGGSPVDISKPLAADDLDVLSETLARDTAAGLERSGRHSDWYEKDVGDAIEIASRLPGNERVASDPIDRFVFGFGMGILSAQNTVEDNAVFADALYGHWAKTGSLYVPPEYASSLGRGIDTTHFETMQSLVDRNGWDDVVKFFSSSDEVRNISKDGEVFLPGSGSFQVNNEHQDAVVPRLSIFGPKIGPFTHAIVNNNFDHLVMDRWTMRQFGSLTGTLMSQTDPDKVRGHASRVLEAASGVRSGNSLWQGLNKSEVIASLKQAAKTGKIDDSSPGWEFIRRTQAAYGRSQGPGRKSFADKTELNLAANNAFKNKVEMQLAPGNGTIAKNVRAVFEEATRRAGMKNVLATQALGWVEIQKLWQSQGYRLKKNPDENTFTSAFSAIRDGRRGRVVLGQSSRAESQGGSAEWMDEIGSEYQSAFDSDVSSDEYRSRLVDVISRMISESKANSRAWCPTGEGGGQDNSCSPASTLSSAGTETKEPEIKLGARQEDIDSRLKGLGVEMKDVISAAGGNRDGTYVFLRPDHERPSEGGLHVECTRDVAGVKDGLFSESVIRNAGPENDPEIVIDHKLMEVKSAVSEDPVKRHAAAREFFRTMTDSVQAGVRIGASRVVLNAAGSPAASKFFRGYTIWPRMGFNAPIPMYLRNKLPPDLNHCRNLLELHATPQGTRWWKDNGTDLDVELDLKKADSPQMQVFGRFVRHFERDRRELAYGTGEGWLSPADQAKLDELWEQIWDDGVLDDYSGDDDTFSQAGEDRAFCPTGEGGGVKNDCSNKDLDESWKESDESVEVWERDDLDRKPPISNADKVRSFSIEDGEKTAKALDSLGLTLDRAIMMGTHLSRDTDVTVGIPGDFTSSSRPDAVIVAATRDVAGVPNALSTAVTIQNGDDGKLVVVYDALLASSAAQQKAPVACAREMIRGVLESVSHCHAEGVGEIVLEAAGSAESTAFKGYRIWPKFGFDGVIPRKFLTRLREQDISPRALEEKRAGRLTIQALYETKAGQEHWEKYGGSIPLTLRLGDESKPGWSRFSKYKSRMGELRSFSPGNEVFTPDELEALEEIWEEIRREAAEKRAFCPTGLGGGVDNSCGGGPRVLAAPHSDAGGGWGGKTESWGKSSLTEIWTSSKPLFSGAERFASIQITRPNDVKGVIEDELGISVSDAILGAGPISKSVERSGITRPRLEVMPGQYGGVEMHWSSMGVSNGSGYAEDEKQYAPRPGTAVKAVEASRYIQSTKSGLVLKMNGFFIHPDFRGNGIGVESVLHSTSAPVARLEMDAERYDHPDPNQRMTGYAVWPKYGYDAPMSVVRDSLRSGGVPDFLSKAKTISDVFAIPGGRDWWIKNGGPIRLVFDRSPRSRSMQTMLKYSDRPRSNRSMPNQEQLGHDSDSDEAVDSFWKRVQSGEEKLSGTVMTQDEYERWAAESQEAAKDGKSGEVQAH